MPQLDETILDCLRRAVHRDLEKGGDGIRSTSEIAEWCGVSVRRCRSRLDALSALELIDWFGPIEGLGSVHHWRIADPAPDEGEREALPLAA